jgi:hypothetical protein
MSTGKGPHQQFMALGQRLCLTEVRVAGQGQAGVEGRLSESQVHFHLLLLATFVGHSLFFTVTDD